MVAHSDIEFLYEPFSNDDIIEIEREYNNYVLKYGYYDSWSNFWRDSFHELSSSVQNKVKEDGSPYHWADKYFLAEMAFSNQMGRTYVKKLQKKFRDPFFRISKKLGEQRAKEVLNSFKRHFMHIYALNVINPDVLEEDCKKEIDVKDIAKKISTQFSQIIRSEIMQPNISMYIWPKISYEELNGEGPFDPFEVIRDEYGPEVSQTLITMIKKEMFGQFISGKPLPDIVEDLKPAIKSKTPEMLHDDLFRRGWNLLCLVILPRYFDDHEKQIFEKRPFSGKHDYAIVPADKISDRLGAGGIRNLANQASQMPSGAGGVRPAERFTGSNRAKPPTRKP
jgi:hypothetical protein